MNEILENPWFESLVCLEVIGDKNFQEVVIRGKELIIIITMGVTPTQSRVRLGVLLTSSPIKSCKSLVSLTLSPDFMTEETEAWRVQIIFPRSHN